MRGSSRAAVLAVSLAAVVASSAQGYPISPVPLWSLVERSETIVFAEVTDVSGRRLRQLLKFMDDDELPMAVASLRVLETWKGPASGEIEVEFPANLLCPAPPRYFEDEDVVAFLYREKGRWQTVGLSYGTLYPEGREELEDLRVMVRRAVALQAKGRVQDAARLDWLVEAAVRPGTRWHGVYELEPMGDELHFRYDRTRSNQGPRLSPAQREKIARGFVAQPRSDHTLTMMLRILARHRDPKVDTTAAAAIEGLLGQTELPYWIGDAMQLVFERFGVPQAAKRIGALRKGCCDIDEDGLRTLWRTAQRELGIPKVVPLQVAQRKVRRTGPETPP
jgi:hypothetical protein